MHKIEGRFGRWYDSVTLDGKPLDPERSLRVMRHSPDGFAWGYGGSGPAQLALAILLEVGLDEERALALHQDFKRAFIAPLPRRDFSETLDIEGWANAHPWTPPGNLHPLAPIGDHRRAGFFLPAFMRVEGSFVTWDESNQANAAEWLSQFASDLRRWGVPEW